MTVHMAANITTLGRMLKVFDQAVCSRFGSTPRRMVINDDPSKVTCKRCLKAMGAAPVK